MKNFFFHTDEDKKNRSFKITRKCEKKKILDCPILFELLNGEIKCPFTFLYFCIISVSLSPHFQCRSKLSTRQTWLERRAGKKKTGAGDGVATQYSDGVGRVHQQPGLGYHRRQGDTASLLLLHFCNTTAAPRCHHGAPRYGPLDRMARPLV